jgi:two-component system, NtrC family, sensor kinase
MPSGEGDEECISAVAWLRLNDWALVVRVPSARAFAPIRRARMLIVGILLLASAMIVVLVFGNTARIIRQLEKADSDRDEMQDQLFSAAKLASVGEMAAGVAHEINNPLAIIHEEAGMMLDCLDPEFGQELDPEDFRERLGEITNATIRGRNITAKLLAFSRRHDSAPEPTDLNEIIRRTLAMKNVEFKVSNIDLETYLAPDLPRILANENQLEQVFLNLLNNTRDAMPDGGRVTVRTSREGSDVRVEFSDRGCGMDAETLDRIFFPFFTTKEVGRGTGLGLSISYGIVQSHGGRIEVASEPGEGTRFRIYLPVPSTQAKPATEGVT